MTCLQRLAPGKVIFKTEKRTVGPRKDMFCLKPLGEQGSAGIRRANFYKCGNETSHPHWLSWMPLAERNFHDPSSFGQLVFDP